VPLLRNLILVPVTAATLLSTTMLGTTVLGVTAVPAQAATAASALTSSASTATSTATTASTASRCPRPSGAVGCAPAQWPPHLLAKTSKTNQIRQIVQCGSRMYAVGTFQLILGRNPRTGKFIIYHRSNAFSFEATRPYAVTSWNPNVSGQVNSIAVGSNCTTAYLGGTFTQVHGKSRRNVAAVDTAGGAVRSGFQGDASGAVETLLLHGGRLLTGGYFTKINGASARYFAGLSPTSGKPDAYLRLDISGNYSYPGVVSNATRVYNQQISPDGGRLLVEGDFTSVAGQPRQQIFMISLDKDRARLTGWTSPEFDAHCWTTVPFYIRAAAWGPTGTAIYLADTGYQPDGNTQQARSGLCDSVSRFPVTQTSVSHFWVNYTGCDSLYSVAAGYGTLYVGGHERWADNSDGCDNQGAGGVSAQGMGGFVENTGALLTENDGKGLYVRSRGLGADDLLLTSAGLWIASDNQTGLDAKGKPYTSTMCGGASGHAGLCFLPK
jgi:hypothetical protein